MHRRRAAAAVLCAIAALAAALLTAQSRHGGGNRWAQYEAEMQDPIDDPPDAWEKTEFAFARLRFRSNRDRYWGGHARWGTDANKSERQFISGLRRLTRIHSRSIEEIVDIDSDEIYNWPWLYAVGIGDWNLTESHAARLRQYFLRGGFLMVDDFHGDREWNNFETGIRAIFPEGRIVELQDDDPIFHVVYDLSQRIQVSGFQVIRGMPYERNGVVPHWRAVMDPQGRVVVAICFNMDLGDAWEWADYPPYPEKYSSMAYRMGVNYVIYSMTH